MRRGQEDRQAEPTGAAPAEFEPSARLLGRTGGALYAAACLVALGWALFARLAAGHRLALVLLIGVGLAIAAGIVAYAERIPPWAYAWLVGVAVLLVSAAVALSHGLGSPLALLYLWGAVWAISFLPQREAAVLCLLSVAGYGLAALLAGEGLSRTRAAGWVVVAGTVVALAGFVAVLVQALRRRDAEVLQREHRFRAIFESTADALYITDDERRFVEVNDAACELFGRSREELLALRLDDTWMDAEALEQTWAIFRSRGAARFEHDLETPAGCVRRVDVISSAEIEPGRHASSMRDVTGRRDAERRLGVREAQQAAVAEFGASALAGRAVGGLLEEAADAVSGTLGVSFVLIAERDPAGEFRVGAARGVPPGLFGESGSFPAAVRSASAYVLATDAPVLAEDLARERRFRVDPALLAAGLQSGLAVPIPGRNRPFGVLIAAGRERRRFGPEDVNFLSALANLLAGAVERQGAESAMRHRSFHDPLTELPNRLLFLDRLGLALSRRERRPSALAVMFVDLDNFKAVNDTFGHRAGDELLVGLAPRLRAAVRETDTIARLSGDEFAVLCEDVSGPAEAKEIAVRLLDALGRPLTYGGQQAPVRASVGIAMAEDGTPSAESLLQDADAALYGAKERGRGRYELFDQSMRRTAVARTKTESELRRALEGRELQVALEPVIDLATGRIHGVEALARWDHPRHGRLSADEFVPVAEASGLIVPLGRWMLAAACREAAAWPGEEPPWVSVNLSAREITEPGIFEAVESALTDSELPPRRLRVEITESALLEEAELPEDVLTRLAELGVSLVLDDFGTGYSSLAYLHRFSVDALKIDRSFVAGLARSEADTPIISAIVQLAGALGIEVIGEGVEREDQAARLTGLGCRLGQGWWCGRERTPEQMARELARSSPPHVFVTAGAETRTAPAAARRPGPNEPLGAKDV